MGTVLYERGIFLNVCYDELSRSDPELVAAVHRAYVEAGAELVETNTFGANPVKLSAFGLDADTEAINRAGASVARSAAGSRARVLGAMGPLGIRIEPWGPTGADEARDFFGRQVDGLLGRGGADGPDRGAGPYGVEGVAGANAVDGFILETFQDPAELRQALEAIRARCDLPVLAQVTLAEGGRTAYGADVETLVRELEDWGVDAVGFNCSVGPAGILEAVERAAEATGLPILAQPNAGFPRTVGDRKMYLASPEYMARYARRMVDAGARFVGGCCGTTPEHVRCMGEALAETDRTRDTTRSGPRQAAPAQHQQPARTVPEPPASPALPLGERSRLGAALQSGDFVSLVEVVPPRGWDPEALLAQGLALRDAGVTAVTIPDAPRGLARMGSLPAATLLARDTGVEVLAHYACRDRNMIGMISDLLGAAASGVRNILLVTGDLSPTGPYPDHTTIFDIDSIGLTNVVRRLNEGHDPGGHPVEPPTRFVIGVTLNQGAVDREREDRRFRFKVEAGAEYAVTQPVFDPGTLLGFLDRHAGHAARFPVIAGIWPLTSLGNAEFLANEVPGVVVPAGVVERMRAAERRGPEAATEEGIRIAVENVEAVRHRVRGIHVAAPRGRIDLALAVLARAGLQGAPA
ncbi:MAG: bifunctional homocysteine S-methyltransferase/methylenetetrahydrofolate reductase [Gemmatimonadales bacterium]|nr:MAG: bifunctional homocysteine S-methyltransferase/methylenetetrahydrofolate reductase [Gemmatimonadales bacterium]